MEKNLYKQGNAASIPARRHWSVRTALAMVFGLLFALSGTVVAQTGTTITGKVTDKQGALPGASVVEKGTSNGTTTDAEGKFTLQLPAGSKLITISSVGYVAQDVDVTNKSTVDVQLAEDQKTLNEVVVIGYGSLNKREVSSAITHLGSADLLRVGSNNPLMSIQGKVAGLSVTNTSAADPNSSPNIQLRGASSRNAGLGPLYVVNGIPGGNIDNINQNEIESIDVLKGGAASAIYGTRGSNGVIVITTKKGSAESRLFYDGYTSFDYLANELKVLSKDDFLANKRGVDFGGNTDWMKAVSRQPAFAHKHTLQFSGGNGKTNYFSSVDYRDANGIDLRAGKKEYGGRVNINHTTANDLFALTFSVAPRYAKTSEADYSGFNYALTLNPTQAVLDSAGRYAYINSGFFANNPVEQAKSVTRGEEIKFLDVNGSAKWNILQNLNTTVTFGEVTRSARAQRFTPSYITTVVNGSGRNTAYQALNENDQKSLEWLGNYFLDVNKHSLKLLAGYSYQLFTSSGFDASNEKFPSDVLTYNGLGTGLWNLEKGINGVSSYKNSSKLIAFFGRVNYDFDQKYYLSASLRREGSSKFGFDNKWGFFPAASLAWRVTQEDFAKNISWLNELKVRADYGETGNQDFGNYLSLDTYGGYGYYPYNGNSYQVWGPSQNTNYNLRWEKAANFNAGVDFELFSSRLSGSLNYYVRTNKDLLGYYNVSNPPNIQGQTFANVGTMRNTGVELQLSASVVKKGSFSYDLGLTGAWNDNKFVSFSNNLYKGQNYVDVVGMPAPGSPGTLQRLQEGTRIGSFYALKSAGVNENGALLVYNKNGDVVPANEANNDDKQFVGNGLPKFTLGMTNSLKYKNWDLSVFLRGTFGYKLFNTYAFYLGTPAAQENANVLTSAYDKDSKYSKLTSTSTYSSLSDYFLEAGGFLKVDNVTLSYTQPIKSKFMQSARIYATTRNLATFTKFTGGDPDLIQVNGLYPGVRINGDNNGTLDYYPSTTQLLLGLQLTF